MLAFSAELFIKISVVLQTYNLCTEVVSVTALHTLPSKFNYIRRKMIYLTFNVVSLGPGNVSGFFYKNKPDWSTESKDDDSFIQFKFFS